MSARDLVGLITLGTIWGTSYLFIRVAVAEITPFTLVASRIGFAAILLGALLAALGVRLPRDRHAWRTLVFLGLFNQAVPFVLITWGEIHVTAGLASILIATVPLWVALIASALGDERLTAEKVAGVVAGLIGVVVLVGGDARDLLAGSTLGALAVLLAALSYSLAVNLGRRGALRIEPLATALGQMLVAVLVVLPFALLERPWTLRPSPVALGSLASLSVLSSAIAYIIFFGLLRRLQASQVSVVTYVSPATTVLFGALLLHEPVGVRTVIGLGAIALGVALVTGVISVRAVRPAPSPGGS